MDRITKIRIAFKRKLLRFSKRKPMRKPPFEVRDLRKGHHGEPKRLFSEVNYHIGR